jgi:peptidoglycan hydrolase CwlO-like protein
MTAARLGYRNIQRATIEAKDREILALKTEIDSLKKEIESLKKEIQSPKSKN